MNRLSSAAALGLVFFLSYVVTPRSQEELQAQVNIPCNCQHYSGQLVNSVACLGTGNMSAWSCTQVGSVCFLSGSATWTPQGTPQSCVWPNFGDGWIVPIGLGTGATSNFNPWSPANPIAWQVTSNSCGPFVPFGADMWVKHDTYTYNSSTGTCTCNVLTPTSTRILRNYWTCKDV